MPSVAPALSDRPAPAPYQPVWRRPIATTFRRTAHAAVRFCVRHGIHPDTISYLSIVASALAALCLVGATERIWFLLAAPLFCYVRLWLNMLDGMVALGGRQASARGEKKEKAAPAAVRRPIDRLVARFEAEARRNPDAIGHLADLAVRLGYRLVRSDDTQVER